MRFVTYEKDGFQSAGLVLSNGFLVNLHETALQWVSEDRLPGGTSHAGIFATVASLISNEDAVRAVLREMEADGEKRLGRLDRAADCVLLAPIPKPLKNIFCIGRNYIDHVTEGYNARGLAIHIPEFPQFFTKPPTSVTGPFSHIPFDANTMARFDYEVELGVVMGRAGKNIAKEHALDYVFGYTIINDLTARDLQRRHDQWFKGKALDASCPMGPCIVHKDKIRDPQNLAISLTVNGETRQRARTSQMIFDLRTIISDLSQGMTLEPGDIIATGTPSGVGYAMSTPSFLVPGDVVRCEIEEIGIIENHIGVPSGKDALDPVQKVRAYV